jgi:phospholipid/cholesterol/gamma-HCH transport system ATP-binding protein
MIKAENIYKSFGEHLVLKDVSACFEQGKTNLIIGRSGSGKTVLMKALVGLHAIDKGSIYYNERDISSMSPKELKATRKEIGMLFQGGALFDSLNVEDNVAFPLIMNARLSSAERQKRVDFCLDRVNLADAHQLFPSELSGGMIKRVAIARAIALNPPYLFCDEPNSGLDPQTSSIIDNLISEITREYKLTTIINTHDMNSVMEIGEVIFFIHEGKLQWQGDKNSIINTDDKILNDFVFSTGLTRRLK